MTAVEDPGSLLTALEGAGSRCPEAPVRAIPIGQHWMALEMPEMVEPLGDRHGGGPFAAFRRLACAPKTPPGLTLRVVDETFCGIPRPALHWRPEDFGPKRLVPGRSGTKIAAFYLRSLDGICVVDWSRARAFMWVRSLDALPGHERAAPLRWLVDMLAPRLGLIGVHAASVGLGHAGALIVGPGGAGKSTLALAALGAGLTHLADDAVLIDDPRGGGALHIHRLYRSATWGGPAPMPPALGGARIRPLDARDKGRAVFILDTADERPVPPVDLRAIICPAITDAAEPRCEPIPPRAVLGGLAPGTIRLSEAPPGPLMAGLAALVRRVPGYRFALPRDPAPAAEALADLLQRSAAAEGLRA